jgi:26S proteasome non-ATPase regulatory subunit 9
MTTTSRRSRQTEVTKKLIKEKEAIEVSIQDQESILRSHGTDMKTPLIDKDGFPRADIDVYSVRIARATLAKLYNDLKSKMDEIAEALVLLHQCNHEVESVESTSEADKLDIPFAKVNGVAPDSPANIAGLERGDLVIEFGTVSIKTESPLQAIATELPKNEFKSLKIRVRRGEDIIILAVIPKPWGGRGLLGCHLVSVELR